MSSSETVRVQVYDRENEEELVTRDISYVPRVGEYVNTNDGMFRVQNVVSQVGGVATFDVQLIVSGNKD
jgi:hypothetical protein